MEKVFDCEQEKKENILPVCSLIKKQALIEAGCYGAVDKDVHEDWHLWLRMIEKGHYPVRMNYYAFGIDRRKKEAQWPQLKEIKKDNNMQKKR